MEKFRWRELVFPCLFYTGVSKTWLKLLTLDRSAVTHNNRSRFFQAGFLMGRPRPTKDPGSHVFVGGVQKSLITTVEEVNSEHVQ